MYVVGVSVCVAGGRGAGVSLGALWLQACISRSGQAGGDALPSRSRNLLLRDRKPSFGFFNAVTSEAPVCWWVWRASDRSLENGCSAHPNAIATWASLSPAHPHPQDATRSGAESGGNTRYLILRWGLVSQGDLAPRNLGRAGGGPSSTPHQSLSFPPNEHQPTQNP